MKQKIIIIVLLIIVTAFVAAITKNDLVKKRLQDAVISDTQIKVSHELIAKRIPTFKIAAPVIDEFSIPHTDIFISRNGEADIKIGTYQGECNLLASDTPDYFNEVAQSGILARVQCYFAGAGDQIVIKDIGAEYSIDWRSFYEGDSESNGPVAGPYTKVRAIAK